MKDYPALAIPLTDSERDTLTQYEDFLAQHLHIFFEVGRILVTIRNQKLYRETHRTFEAYCAERWQISRSRAYQLMDAADVKEELSTACGQKSLPEPTTEAQTRALKQAPKELRAQVWTAAVNAANGQQPSAPQVKQAVLDFSPKPETEPPQVIHTYDVGQGTVLDTEYVSPSDATPDRLTFNIMFDVDYNCERLEKSLRIRDIDPTMPFLDDVARDKGLCKSCRYDQSGHYLNEHGRKWCTLSILRNEYLKRQLQTEKIVVYKDEPGTETDEAEQDDPFETRLEACRECLEKYYYTKKGIVRIDEVNEHMAHVRGVTYPWPPDSQSYAAMTANFELEDLLYEVEEADWLRAKRRDIEEEAIKTDDKTEKKESKGGILYTCSFCGQFVREGKAYVHYDTQKYFRAAICRQCAANALYDLLKLTDDAISSLEYVVSRMITDKTGHTHTDGHTL